MPEVILRTPVNYLEVCRQANRDFYESVKKIIDSKVVIVHRQDHRNIGDFSSNPALYFDLPVVNVVDIENKSAIVKCLSLGYWFIIGGGGLFSAHKKSRIENINTIIEGGKAIIWGVGKNAETVLPNSLYQYPESLKRARLVGIRDRDQLDYPWVPCASCMSDLFSKEYPILAEKVIYSHAENPIEKGSKTNHDFNDLSECLTYLGSGKKIITNSYHGAYWSQLLNRQVALKNTHNMKYHGLEGGTYHMPSLNDFVDHIYVLSMPSRSERRETLAKQMAEMKSTYTVIDGVTAATGSLGCTLGHIKILETAIKAGHKKIFIVEDDALFRREIIADIAGIMNDGNDYDLLFFHSEPPLPLHLNGHYTFKRGAPWCTHFYAAQNLQKILIYLRASVEMFGKDGIDHLYRDSKLNVRTTVKEYVYQLEDVSDIQGKIVDRFQRKVIHDDFLVKEYNIEKAEKSFWIGHKMLGDVLGFCAAAHLYAKKVGKPVKVWFDPGRRNACRYFEGVLWTASRTPEMIDCGGDPSLAEWPTMNGVKRFYRFMDPTLTPTKSFDVHFHKKRPPADGKLIGLITHSNTQGDIDPVVLSQMLQEARQSYPNHRIVLIGSTDNTIVPEGVEDLRQAKGSIDWIIDMVGRLDLLITPQSGPCFCAAGWGVPMWVYRSKERFWDYTLNYDTYKVERWFDRPKPVVPTIKPPEGEFAVFDKLYTTGGWNGKGSGPGSNIEFNRDYLTLLHRVINQSPVKKIVDLGCGDWQLMKHVDLTNREYLGLDVVGSVISHNIANHSRANINFRQINAVTDEIPDADVYLIKDVLQHLPDAMVFQLLKKLRTKRGWAIITNDYTEKNAGTQIALGGWRQINVLLPPYNFPGITVLGYNHKQVTVTRLDQP